MARLRSSFLSALFVIGLLVPAIALAQDLPSLPPDLSLKLPRDLSPWGMFMAADIVVKLVMIGLAFASVLTWTIWLAKGVELLFARRRLRAAVKLLEEARSWNEASMQLRGSKGAAAELAAAVEAELHLSA